MCYLLTIEKYIYTRLGVLTTIHVTYINKERLYTINTLYSTKHTEQKAKIKEENNSPKKFGVKAPFFARKSAYCCSL